MTQNRRTGVGTACVAGLPLLVETCKYRGLVAARYQQLCQQQLARVATFGAFWHKLRGSLRLQGSAH